MLQIRPNCELCDKDLAPDATDAMICTYECTFCSNCVAHLSNVCPNCGGGFSPRPIRPVNAWRAGVSLGHQPASQDRIHSKYRLEDLADYIDGVKTVPPEKR